VALLTSGGAAGLAGALEVARPHWPADTVCASWLRVCRHHRGVCGRLHPVGMVFSAILMSMFYIVASWRSRAWGCPKSITGVFQGLLLFTLLACDTLIAYRLKWVK
jgi:ABC-type uncharacterized transport system permease subunit